MKTWIQEEAERNPGFASGVEEERLVFSAAESLVEGMLRRGWTKSHLAARLGKSKPFVTQILDGGANLTLRTLARVAHTLGFRVRVSLHPLEAQRVIMRFRNASLCADESSWLAKSNVARVDLAGVQQLGLSGRESEELMTEIQAGAA